MPPSTEKIVQSSKPFPPPLPPHNQCCLPSTERLRRPRFDTIDLAIWPNQRTHPKTSPRPGPPLAVHSITSLQRDEKLIPGRRTSRGTKVGLRIYVFHPCYPAAELPPPMINPCHHLRRSSANGRHGAQIGSIRSNRTATAIWAHLAWRSCHAKYLSP